VPAEVPGVHESERLHDGGAVVAGGVRDQNQGVVDGAGDRNALEDAGPGSAWSDSAVGLMFEPVVDQRVVAGLGRIEARVGEAGGQPGIAAGDLERQVVEDVAQFAAGRVVLLDVQVVDREDLGAEVPGAGGEGCRERLEEVAVIADSVLDCVGARIHPGMDGADLAQTGAVVGGGRCGPERGHQVGGGLLVEVPVPGGAAAGQLEDLAEVGGIDGAQ